MATNYPASLDAFDSIASDKKTSDVVGGRTHRDMHNDLGDAIEAVQAELGTDPAGTFSTVKARLNQLVAYAAKTSAYTATVADHTLNVTSGTFTLDLPAASTCTGQSLRVKNSGTGVVTLDGNSSETIEGIATFPLGKGSYVEITSTGSAWILTGGVPDSGPRNVAALATAGSASSLTMRRRGNLIIVSSYNVSSDFAMDVPSGFGFDGGSFAAPVFKITGSALGGWKSTSGASLTTTNLDDVNYVLTASWPTVLDWPTSLPGTAA